jgi:uncharacterized protein (DUF427 family)/glutaredoxin
VEQASTSTSRIEVLWRPGCPYCSRLRSGLRRAGIETVEHNIWSDPDAAARVRAVTGGDETVPTVVVGDRALVNPSVSEVVSAVRGQFPEDADALVGAGAAHRPRAGWSGAAWTVAVGLAWVGLALWRPTTTWHLAPVLMAAAWPWLVGQDLPSRAHGGRGRLLAAAAAGFAAAALTTLALSGADLLRGPTLLGTAGATTEALAFAGGTWALAALLGLVLSRTAPPPVSGSAWFGEDRVAESADVVLVEGNAYFPMASVHPGLLVPSRTRSVCPWKGVARYFDVTVDGVTLPDAAWSYPHPLPLAGRVRRRVAFRGGVDVRIQ